MYAGPDTTFNRVTTTALPTDREIIIYASLGNYYLIIDGARAGFVPKSSVGRIPVYFTMTYEIFVNQTTSLAVVRSHMDAVERDFLINFGINLARQGNGTSSALLNQKPGCNFNYWCFVSCGVSPTGSDCRTHPHHRSAGYLQRVFPTTTERRSFTFVDFSLCYYDGRHASVRGRGGLGIIVSMHRTNSNIRGTIAHEISHIFGVTHCSATNCVMGIGVDIEGQWCSTCRATIMSAIGGS